MEPIDVDKIRETGECDRETLNRLCGLAESAADMANILLRLLDKMEASGVAAPESPANDTDGILTWIDSLRAECDRLRAENARLRERPENAHVAGLEYKAAQLRAERDSLSEQVRDLEESWTAFAVMTHGHCPGPIYYRKFDGGLSRPYGWTHSHWAEKVGYHATPREAVMAAWRYGWEEENRAAILAEPRVDQCYSGRKADGK